jgi:uncharacterized protein YndB with AHSA1/START domain
MTQAADDYTTQVHFDVPPERVFGTLTNPDSFAAWWTPATGSAGEGGELRLTFAGIDNPLLIHVTEAKRFAVLRWNITACDFLPDWVGTTPGFTLTESGAGECELRFRHEGLNPRLDCYDMCRTGWDQHLPSLRDYIQTGTGSPYTGPR